MWQVNTGTRPGRPAALVIVTAAVLAGTILLAWFQVRESRTLGPETRVPGTPLYVRPPHGWLADPNDPGAFLLPVRTSVGRQEVSRIDRGIKVQYRRLPAFQSPAEILRMLGADHGDLRPARIGPFPAVQMRHLETRRWRRQQVVIESVQRIAILPGGQQISVHYFPMTDLTPADFALLDRICESIRLDDPGASVGPAEALARAAVSLDVPGNWSAALPALPDVPGFFVSGQVDRVPAWSLGVFRTWVAPGREPTQLLTDFAAAYWLILEAQTEAPSWQRDDAAPVAVIRHPDPSRNTQSAMSSWLVAKSPDEAVLIYVYCSAEHLPAADAAAAQIAQTLRFEPLDRLHSAADAAQAGVEIAGKVLEAGPVPWWGELPVQLEYAGQRWGRGEALTVVRKPTGRFPVRGYTSVLLRESDGKLDERTQWELNLRGGAYSQSTEIQLSDALKLTVRESRNGRSESVTRTVDTGGTGPRTYTFQPGSSFLPPPLETLAEARAARESVTCIMESSHLLGAGTYTRLLRALTPDDQGRPRVLVQDDYAPFGAVLTLDSDGEVFSLVTPGGHFERVRPPAP